MMNIQEGKVKYKDREDIRCKYGVTDDNRQYYFIDDKEFKNNSRIASTNLKEAIDPLYASEYAEHIGLVGNEGNEIIPCVNKSIKPVNEDVVLVEPANAISDSVKEAISLKKDPLAATKLVSTPALIKDKINSKMGNNGRYVFNNQFSEATLVDINGNNLVNNEYYSFIAMSPEKIYFSKNTIDSVVGEYSLLPSEVQSNVTPVNDTNEIDVTNVELDSNVVENAMTNENVNEGFASGDITPVALGEDQIVDNSVSTTSDTLAGTETQVDEVVETAPVEAVSENVQEQVNSDEIVIPTIDADEVADTVNETVETPVEATVNEVVENVPVENTVSETVETAPVEDTVSEVVENTPVENTVDEVVEDTPVENTVDETVETAPVEDTVNEVTDDTTDEVSEALDIDLNDSYEDTTLDNMFSEVNSARNVEEDMNEDIFSKSEVKTDSIDYEDEFEDSYTEKGYDGSDTTMKEIAESMANLIKQNKDIKASHNDLVVKYEKANASRKNLKAQADMLEEKVRVLDSKNQSLDSKIVKLESKNDMLEDKIREQERIIESQRRELVGKEELTRLLRDAKVLLDDNSTSYDYDDESSYYRRAA